MKTIRKILFKVLGLRRFIILVSRIYLCMVKKGFLKKKYPELFFLEKIVKPGFVCIDIGANVGYYSVMLAKFSGNTGRVFAVEPIPLFAEIWKKNIKRSGFKSPDLYVCALGSEEKIVRMGVPERNGVVHHGMTKITSTGDENYIKFFDVEMKIPDIIFANLEKVDFVKCDVEGYESEVFMNMKRILQNHLPLVQSELSGEENRIKVVKIFESLGYSVNVLENNNLRTVNQSEILKISSDFYFVPPVK